MLPTQHACKIQEGRSTPTNPQKACRAPLREILCPPCPVLLAVSSMAMPMGHSWRGLASTVSQHSNQTPKGPRARGAGGKGGGTGCDREVLPEAALPKTLTMERGATEVSKSFFASFFALVVDGFASRESSQSSTAETSPREEAAAATSPLPPGAVATAVRPMGLIDVPLARALRLTPVGASLLSGQPLAKRPPL